MESFEALWGKGPIQKGREPGGRAGVSVRCWSYRAARVERLVRHALGPWSALVSTRLVPMKLCGNWFA